MGKVIVKAASWKVAVDLVASTFIGIALVFVTPLFAESTVHSVPMNRELLFFHPGSIVTTLNK